MTEAMVVERLKHGCPNCGNPWGGDTEGLSLPSTIVFSWPPGNGEKTALKICHECAIDFNRIKRRRILSTLKGFGWPPEKLRSLGIAIALQNQKRRAASFL